MLDVHYSIPRAFLNAIKLLLFFIQKRAVYTYTVHINIGGFEYTTITIHKEVQFEGETLSNTKLLV